MLPESKPILFKTPEEFESVEIYPIHDLHYGNVNFNMAKWKAVKNHILSEPNRYIIWVGDLFENAVPNSKSSVFEQVKTPLEQREFISEQLTELADRTIACIDGNHEFNRSTKLAGLYPLYDCCCIARISDRYRSAFCVVDISVGHRANRHNNHPLHYTIFATHVAKSLKNFASCDELEGIDIFLCGHDHKPNDRPMAKLVYNQTKRIVYKRNIENINCGSFLEWAGGYGSRQGLRPQSDKYYKLILGAGTEKSISTLGFYF